MPKIDKTVITLAGVQRVDNLLDMPTLADEERLLAVINTGDFQFRGPLYFEDLETLESVREVVRNA